MASLVWDDVGRRVYQTGVDRGVLYFSTGAVAWNGLISIEEQSDQESKPYYLDGVKYLQRQLPGDFSAKLKAFTYPEEFDQFIGIDTDVDSGVSYYNQAPKSFGMSYRTRIGNDVDGIDHGYKIHVLYNMMAVPDGYGYQTIDETIKPTEFSWTLSGTPPVISGHRPTCHLAVDSRYVPPEILQAVENILYGTDQSNPSLPDIEQFTDLLGMYGSLVIVDNGDGTWQAIDIADMYITMDNETTFTIDNVYATYLDASTYEISTTNPA